MQHGVCSVGRRNKVHLRLQNAYSVVITVLYMQNNKESILKKNSFKIIFSRFLNCLGSWKMYQCQFNLSVT